MVSNIDLVEVKGGGLVEVKGAGVIEVEQIIKRVQEHHDKLQAIPKNTLKKFMEKAEALYNGEELDEYFFNLALYASEELDIGLPIWEYVAGSLYLQGAKYHLQKERGGAFGYEYSYYELMKTFSEKGMDATENGISVFAQYTKEELEEAGTWIDDNRDLEMKYISVRQFLHSYSEKFGKERYASLPQERYLTIALFLSQNKENRMEEAKRLYWHLSHKTLSPATPIMSNANTSNGQMSSCFIDTTADNIEDIYASNKDLAKVSKMGGGIGVYMGKIRARGSWIKNIQGASSGTLP